MRFIFRRYAELGSVRLLKDELEAREHQEQVVDERLGPRRRRQAILARRALPDAAEPHLSRRDRSQGTIPSRRTRADHRSAAVGCGPGAARRQYRRAQLRQHDTRQPSLLAGMLFDGDGNRMTPSHAVKKGTRYRYYVSRSLITKDQTENSAGLRIPAAEIEQLVTSRVQPMASRSRQHLPGDYGLPIRRRSAGWSREPRKSARAGPSCPQHASVLSSPP